MKFPLNWLQDYINIEQPPLQISRILTRLGLEVDSFQPAPLDFEKVVVGKVLAVEPHPEADKLQIAQVSDGQKTHRVVCGASNCRAGIKTAFALDGAVLHDEQGNGFSVRKTKIRGVESEGMLCSEKELLLSDSHEGIIEFAPHILEGADVAELYSDTLFEVSLTPNLGHCASLIGVARELSAALEIPVKLPIVTVKEAEGHPIEKSVKVKVEDPALCPRYACRVIEGVQIGPSPLWLQKRIKACGMRPVNNVVDVTNYVLMEFGHPLHAFDLDRISGHQVVVRRATDGEKMLTLDAKERVLAVDDLVICDQERPIALAGIMGGLHSEVDNNTKNILIESAYFLPSSIRKTSKRLGLQTEGSRRFERGADPNQVREALDRAAMLIQQIAGGKVCESVIDMTSSTFPQTQVKCRLSRINHLLGTHLGLSEVERFFKNLGFHPSWDGVDTFLVKVPTYRVDIKEEVDLIEEVARLYGYDNIPKIAPRYHSSTLPHAPIFEFETEVRKRLISQGLQEFLTCDLIGPSILDIVGEPALDDPALIRVLNPTSIEQSILRTSLLPGLLGVVKHNFSQQNHQVAGFEIGRIHFKMGDQYKEQTAAAIVLFGKSRPAHWDPKPVEVDFFDLKGMVENVLAALGFKDVVLKMSELPTLHPGRQAAIFAAGVEVGTLGEVHPSIVRRLDVPERIYFAILNLHDIYKVRTASPFVKPLAIYPSSARDWTVTLPEEMPIEKMLSFFRTQGPPLLESVSLWDLYQNEKLGEGVKNVTFRFVYRDLTKTVAQDSVDAEHAKVVEQAMKAMMG